MKIPITFLGTGQAIPTIERNHVAMLLSYKNENILIDCGEGTQRQFRKAKLNPCKLTKLLITHWHGDHILGIPGLLQTLALNNYNKTLDVYGPKGTKKFMSIMLDMFVFAGKIKVNIHEIKTENKFLETSDFYITVKKMKHGAPCLAYSFIEKDKIKIKKSELKKLKIPNIPLLNKLKQGKDILWGGKQIKAKQLTYKEKGKKISFILDTEINKNSYALAENSDLLICESTYTKAEKDKAREYKHLTTEQAANIAKKSNSKALILTHISQRYKDEKLLLAEAKKIFKNTTIAKDLDKIEI